jgi:hypothetical protein
MIDLSVLDVPALAALRLVAWANVGMALALLVAVAVWIVCCGWSDRLMDRDPPRVDAPT